jgi:hypothetical protein
VSVCFIIIIIIIIIIIFTRPAQASQCLIVLTEGRRR